MFAESDLDIDSIQNPSRLGIQQLTTPFTDVHQGRTPLILTVREWLSWIKVQIRASETSNHSERRFIKQKKSMGVLDLPWLHPCADVHSSLKNN